MNLKKLLIKIIEIAVIPFFKNMFFLLLLVGYFHSDTISFTERAALSRIQNQPNNAARSGKEQVVRCGLIVAGRFLFTIMGGGVTTMLT